MIKINQTVIVEGKYDKIKLKSVIDANIITTDGFGIYNNIQKRGLIKKIAEKTGIIILTDSDKAGKRIRDFVKNCVGDIDSKQILNVYIPKISGREKRKNAPSKENTLGVEGVNKNLLLEILNKFGVVDESGDERRGAHCASADHDEFETRTAIGRPYEKTTKQITKTDFYQDGLSGGENSSKKREYLCEKLNIPYMQANSLLETVNILTDYEEYKKIIGGFQ